MSARIYRLIPLLLWLLSRWPAPGLAQQPLAATDSQPVAAGERSSQLLRAEQAVRDEGYAPSRLLALGQAQLETGQLGPAIVSFERGLVLAPRDTALREALAAARARAGLDAPAADEWPARAVQGLSVREWSFAAWASCLGLCVSLLGLTLLPRRKRLFVTGVLVSGLTLAASGGAAYAARQRLNTAFVLHDDSVLRQSPFDSASVLERLRPGEAVEPRSQHADFTYVVSERGQAGWVRSQELATIAQEGAPAS